MERARDERFMRRALALAERGWGWTAPNPMVGAVVARDDRVVGEGWHARFGGPHAEVAALVAAGDLARGATLYVTLEPCNHHGKTPPCTDAVLAAGVARVVFATRDPGAQSGGGADRLGTGGVAVTGGVLEAEARELNAPFFFGSAADRPWVTLKLAVSIDGAISDAGRSGGWLTGPAARREVHRMRANSDAIAVGASTFRSDRPSLTVRDAPAPRVPPRRLVFDRAGTVALDDVADGAAPWTVIRDPDPAAALRRLRREGVRSLLVEGGAGLASELLDAGVVDRLVIFQAPIVLGRGALPAFAAAVPRRIADVARYRVVRRAAFDDDLMSVYALRPL